MPGAPPWPGRCRTVRGDHPDGCQVIRTGVIHRRLTSTCARRRGYPQRYPQALRVGIGRAVGACRPGRRPAPTPTRAADGVTRPAGARPRVLPSRRRTITTTSVISRIRSMSESPRYVPPIAAPPRASSTRPSRGRSVRPRQQRHHEQPDERRAEGRAGHLAEGRGDRRPSPSRPTAPGAARRRSPPRRRTRSRCRASCRRPANDERNAAKSPTCTSDPQQDDRNVDQRRGPGVRQGVEREGEELADRERDQRQRGDQQHRRGGTGVLP